MGTKKIGKTHKSATDEAMERLAQDGISDEEAAEAMSALRKAHGEHTTPRGRARVKNMSTDLISSIDEAGSVADVTK